MRERLEESKVHVSKRLIDAMWAVERSALEIALIVDDSDRLIGILTDGDIRRALLNGAGIDAPVADWLQRQFTSVTPRAGRVEVMDLMRARKFGQIPIVDDAGRLVGLHLLHDILGAEVRPNWAVIMAGGKGTRLRPITEQVPKPMLRVAGRPILERIVLHLVGSGIRRLFLSINYLGHLIEEHFGDGKRFGCSIEYLREEKPLGTGGSLSLLPEHPADPLVVMNGDLVTEADIGAMLDFHRAGGQQATLAVRRYFHIVPFGCVDVEGSRVVRMEEKPTLTRLVNAGIYVLDPSVVARAPQHQIGMPDLLEQCLAQNEGVGAFEIEADWIDVGQREQLKLAREGES
jgi:dTDP-glucose pyrophosphorylase